MTHCNIHKCIIIIIMLCFYLLCLLQQNVLKVFMVIAALMSALAAPTLSVILYQAIVLVSQVISVSLVTHLVRMTTMEKTVAVCVYVIQMELNYVIMSTELVTVETCGQVTTVRYHHVRYHKVYPIKHLQLNQTALHTLLP